MQKKEKEKETKDRIIRNIRTLLKKNKRKGKRKQRN